MQTKCVTKCTNSDREKEKLLLFFFKPELQNHEHVIQHIMDHYHKDTEPLLLCHFLHAHPYFLCLPRLSQRGGEKMLQSGDTAVSKWPNHPGNTIHRVHTGRDTCSLCEMHCGITLKGNGYKSISMCTGKDVGVLFVVFKPVLAQCCTRSMSAECDCTTW